MASLPIIMKRKKTGSTQQISLQVDAAKLEQLADLFGFYQPDFLQSLDRAESDIRAGRVKTIRSIKDLAM